MKNPFDWENAHVPPTFQWLHTGSGIGGDGGWSGGRTSFDVHPAAMRVARSRKASFNIGSFLERAE
jgi:hypothetical protein